MDTAISVQVAEPGADAQRLDDLAARLREELLGLDVDNVVPEVAGDAPDGSRALELAAMGALLVTLKQSSELVAAVVNTVREWLKRDPEPSRSVTLSLGDRSIALTGVSSELQDRMVAEFLKSALPAPAAGTAAQG